MKIKMLVRAVIALACGNLALATLPAPLPSFVSAADLRKASPAKPDAPARLTQPNYTGKPYDEASQSYLFAARNYLPENGRWMTLDPTGFPDGANNSIYSTNPLTGVDPDGCAWTTIDFLKHYYMGGGAPVTLTSMGLLSAVKGVAWSAPAGGLYRFGNQIARNADGISKPYNGSFTDSFSKTYDFGSVDFAMGNGVLSGSFNGNMTSTPYGGSTPGGTYSYTGTADISFSDDFTDPLDIIQALYGSSSSSSAPAWLVTAANLGGTPFHISDTWTETYTGSGTYE